MVFELEGELRPDARHRFRLEIPLIEVPDAPPGVDTDEFRRVGEPIVLDFEVAVRPTKVVGVDRAATAGGITLRMDRAIDSQGKPGAVVCLEAEDGVRDWSPSGRDLATGPGAPVAVEGDCLRIPLGRPLDGPSSVTVEQVQINPFCPSCAREEEVIRGPWRFDFEVPAP